MRRGVIRGVIRRGSKGSDPDKPKIGHHFARRKADKCARDNMQRTLVTKEVIDDNLGWKIKERKKDQQLHYAGIIETELKARCTMFL